MNEDEILAILERHGYIELASPEEIEVALKELRTIPAGYPDADMRIRHYERMLVDRKRGKLPVLSTFSGAYGFVLSEIRTFLKLAVPAIIILAVFETILASMAVVDFAGVPGAEEGSILTYSEANLNIGVLAVTAVYILTTLALWVTFCVAWHRHYLVPEEIPTTRSVFRWTRRQTRFVLILCGISAIFLLVSLVGLFGAFIINFFILASLLNICAAFVWARFALLLPATAVDRRMSFVECWDFTQGNGWRLVLLIFLTELPVGSLISVSGNLFGPVEMWPQILAVMFVNQILVFVAFAVGVSALSIAYRSILSQSTIAS